MLLEAVGSGSPAHPERSPHDASFYHRPPAPTVGSLPVLRGIEPGTINWGFYHSSVGKESACCAGDPGSIPGSRRSPGEGNGNPQQYSCLGNPMTEEPGGLQSMGSQESDMTEQLTHQDKLTLPVVMCLLEVGGLWRPWQLLNAWRDRLLGNWACSLMEPVGSCVTAGKSLHLSGPWCPLPHGCLMAT